MNQEPARQPTAATGDWSAVRDDHNCFGCGRLNPCGLHLTFGPTVDGDGVWAPFEPAPAHEGYAGVVHGGIVSALLDEAMAWAAFARGAWVVTARIDVRFRRPVEIGVPVRVVGRVLADRGRIVEATGEVRRAGDDALLAEAAGVFARVPEDQAQAWRSRYVAELEAAGSDDISK